jgi:hypothetical protein
MVSDTGVLLHRWVHSHEEDRGDEMVFRPGSYAFGPSRGRRSMEFKKDGTLLAGGPGPVDRSVSAKGSWTRDADELTLEVPGNQPEHFTIVSVDKEKLVLRKQ